MLYLRSFCNNHPYWRSLNNRGRLHKHLINRDSAGSPCYI
ncbi:hypothetical protein H1P_440013 [Hyella patelloides LEGE 07179]|uniref:Uncharacterized protein n=1 Tax=Hyella patelloides LEGE 07179 TaxID=945734 RepID=A0A563VY72_9CYAN|nr:hypothetical protein H1P_440013 [Hyella patelloides LEGE 07179]